VNTQLRSVLLLTGFALTGTLAITLTKQATEERIANNEAAYRSQLLREVLLDTRYDNEPWNEAISVDDESVSAIYPVTLGDATVGEVVQINTNSGYVGPITMLIATDVNARIIAVRVSKHQETPGLGDAIDRNKSGWIDVFSGASIETPPTWSLKRDGGDFDQITGATITSRAVVNAVHDALLYKTKD